MGDIRVPPSEFDERYLALAARLEALRTSLRKHFDPPALSTREKNLANFRHWLAGTEDAIAADRADLERGTTRNGKRRYSVNTLKALRSCVRRGERWAATLRADIALLEAGAAPPDPPTSRGSALVIDFHAARERVRAARGGA